MTKELLIYNRATPVRAEAHQAKSITPIAHFHFAADVNSVPVVAAEFAAAAADMSVVFAGTQEAVMPAVLLGLEQNQNRFVAQDGRWTGRYVPAFLRRYPFVFASAEGSDDLTLCIDESYDGLNDEGHGERLFDAAGERSLYLNGVLDFAVQYQAQYERTHIFCDRLVAHNLLESVVASFTDETGAEKRLTGFFRINRDRLKAIDPALLAQMFSNDELELCFIHLASLANIDRLAERPAPPAPLAIETPTSKKKVQ